MSDALVDDIAAVETFVERLKRLGIVKGPGNYFLSGAVFLCNAKLDLETCIQASDERLKEIADGLDCPSHRGADLHRPDDSEPEKIRREVHDPLAQVSVVQQ